MKKVVVFLKNLVDNLKNLVDNIMPSLLSLLEKLSARHALLLIFIYIPLGQLINHYQPLKNLGLYQFLFGIAIILAVWNIKYFLNKIKKFKKMTASHPINFISSNIYSLVYSKWSIPGLIIISSLFIYATIKLHYVELNLMGIYTLLIVLIIMITAVLGQTFYIYYLILLYRIEDNDDFKYSFYLPSNTEWLVYLVRIGRQINNSFFILGFIYTLVFYINMPSEFIIFNSDVTGNFLDKIEINSPDNLILLIGWVTIFIIIIIAFPLYYFLQISLIKAIVRKLKDISISQIEQLIDIEKNQKKKDIDNQLKYYTLMTNLDKSSNFPIPRNNFIPVISSLSTISVHIIKISESFL